jgi:hypothetical protein
MQQEAYIRLLRVVCAQPYDWVRNVDSLPAIRQAVSIQARVVSRKQRRY